MTAQEQVAALLDTPVTILETIYDLAMDKLPNAVAELRKARVGTMTATNEYELAYRKAQLEVMTKADTDGVKMTEGKRELIAKDQVAEQYMVMNIAKALEASNQDVVFEFKDQLAAMYAILSWKQTELKNSVNTVNTPHVDMQPAYEPADDDLADFEVVR